MIFAKTPWPAGRGVFRHGREEADMMIRAYETTDCEALAKLFQQTVHTANARDYTPRQLDAWAPGQVDLAAWDRSFREHHTLVAVENGVVVGFGDMDRTGYLDRLFVHPDFQHRGIAAAICDRLENASAANRFTVHASITAKPFFESRGYRTVKTQTVLRNDVTLTNYLMEKAPVR